MPLDHSSTKPTDHRTRVASARRERMRARLVESALLVFGERGADGSVIDELIRIAGVSRGTFYNYFRTNEELLSAVAIAVGAEMMRAVDPLVQHEPDPASRIAAGVGLHLGLVRAYPHLGAFLVRGGIRAQQYNGLVREYLPRDLAAGIASGQFSVRDHRVAFDVVVGSVLAGIFTVHAGEASEHYPHVLAQAVLQALGLEAGLAREIAWRPPVTVALSPESLIVRSGSRVSET